MSPKGTQLSGSAGRIWEEVGNTPIPHYEAVSSYVLALGRGQRSVVVL